MRKALLMAVSCLLVGGLQAQNTDFNPLGREMPLEDMQKQLRIQVEWIEVDHELYTELMTEDDPARPVLYHSNNDGPLRVELTKLTKDGKARILDTMMVMAKSGQRAKAEAIQEYIYPSEYDPPGRYRAKKKAKEAAAAAAQAAAKAKREGKEPPEPDLAPPAEVEDDEEEDDEDTYPVTPAAFETRNVGSTLEVDPVIGADGVTIDLNLNPEIVYLTGQEIYGEYRTDIGDVDLVMPLFYTMRVTTSVTVIAGEHTMVGLASPFDEETGLPDRSRKVMVFIKADLLLAGKPLDE